MINVLHSFDRLCQVGIKSEEVFALFGEALDLCASRNKDSVSGCPHRASQLQTGKLSRRQGLEWLLQ